MLSRILFSCSRAAEEGPRLLTTLEAEMRIEMSSVIAGHDAEVTELYTGSLLAVSVMIKIYHRGQTKTTN